MDLSVVAADADEGADDDVEDDAAQAAAPPTLTLRGPTHVTVEAHAGYTRCGAAAPMTEVCDHGATAADVADGDLTIRVAACATTAAPHPFSMVGVAGCVVDTAVPGVYPVTFSVANSAGAVAEATRFVTVKRRCDRGEVLCADLVSCSVQGVCEDDLQQDVGVQVAKAAAAAAEGAPPTIRLLPVVTHAETGVVTTASVIVRQHSGYAACGAAGVTFSMTAAACEPGATATDAVGRDLTAAVLACPPPACVQRGVGCGGHEFALKGLRGCVNTSATVRTLPPPRISPCCPNTSRPSLSRSLGDVHQTDPR